jgi:hypothetical protein
MTQSTPRRFLMKLVVPIALTLVATLIAVMASRLIARSTSRIEWPPDGAPGES